MTEDATALGAGPDPLYEFGTSEFNAQPGDARAASLLQEIELLRIDNDHLKDELDRQTFDQDHLRAQLREEREARARAEQALEDTRGKYFQAAIDSKAMATDQEIERVREEARATIQEAREAAFRAAELRTRGLEDERTDLREKLAELRAEVRELSAELRHKADGHHEEVGVLTRECTNLRGQVASLQLGATKLGAENDELREALDRAEALHACAEKKARAAAEEIEHAEAQLRAERARGEAAEGALARARDEHAREVASLKEAIAGVARLGHAGDGDAGDIHSAGLLAAAESSMAAAKAGAAQGTGASSEAARDTLLSEIARRARECERLRRAHHTAEEQRAVLAGRLREAEELLTDGSPPNVKYLLDRLNSAREMRSILEKQAAEFKEEVIRLQRLVAAKDSKIHVLQRDLDSALAHLQDVNSLRAVVKELIEEEQRRARPRE